MSISDDRAELVNALKSVFWPNGKVTVLASAPALLAPYQVYLELDGIEDGKRFGTIRNRWNVYITTPAVKQISDAETLLDAMANSCIKGVQESGVADFAGSGTYIGLSEPVNGATFPAVRLSFNSTTTL